MPLRQQTGRRIYRWLNPGLLGQTRRYETVGTYSHAPKWRWRLARLTFRVLVTWRKRIGWYDRHPRKSA